MDFENIIQRFQNAILEENQKKIDILCNIYMASSFSEVSLQTQYEKIEEMIASAPMKLKVSLKMVKIHILSRICL
jgi:hypothetical protein